MEHRQQDLLERRYDLSDRPIAGVMMSGGRKAVQGGVGVKLPSGVTWAKLATTSPDEIRRNHWMPANLPDRTNQAAMMAQMQNIIDFPPAPKLDVMGHLDPNKATRQELAGEKVFMVKRALCAVPHPGPVLHGRPVA